MYIYWLVISKEMDQYIRYHKKPYAKYLDVQSFNKKYGTNIREVEDYDLYFHYMFTEGKRKQGPDDFLQIEFATPDEFEEMVDWSIPSRKDVESFGKGIWGFGKKIFGKKKKKEEPKDPKKKKGEAATTEEPKKKDNNGKDPKKPPGVADLDDLLSDHEENVVEEEYDEEIPAATPAPVKEASKNIVTEKKQIADLVLKAAKDSEEYSRDMKHLIQFKSKKFPLEEQLMKGRPKYLKALRAYLKGDDTVEVKMSFKTKGKMVKVADLNPKRDSLKALLRSTPGALRVVECV